MYADGRGLSLDGQAHAVADGVAFMIFGDVCVQLLLHVQNVLRVFAHESIDIPQMCGGGRVHARDFIRQHAQHYVASARAVQIVFNANAAGGYIALHR